MNIAIWIIQVILAVMFGMVGGMKTTQSKEKLAPKLPWVHDFPAAVIRFIGAAELAGAIGLIIPQLTGIIPVLTPLAAAGLALIMILASIYHLRKREYNAIAFNSALFILSSLVAYGRF